MVNLTQKTIGIADSPRLLPAACLEIGHRVRKGGWGPMDGLGLNGGGGKKEEE
jgi:hypothetical protein